MIQEIWRTNFMKKPPFSNGFVLIIALKKRKVNAAIGERRDAEISSSKFLAIFCGMKYNDW